MEIQKKHSPGELNKINYRCLQQMAKSMHLPCKVKKNHLVALIVAKVNNEEAQIKSIIEKVEIERKQVIERKRTTNNKRKQNLQSKEVSSTSTYTEQPLETFEQKIDVNDNIELPPNMICSGGTNTSEYTQSITKRVLRSHDKKIADHTTENLVDTVLHACKNNVNISKKNKPDLVVRDIVHAKPKVIVEKIEKNNKNIKTQRISLEYVNACSQTQGVLQRDNRYTLRNHIPDSTCNVLSLISDIQQPIEKWQHTASGKYPQFLRKATEQKNKSGKKVKIMIRKSSAVKEQTEKTIEIGPKVYLRCEDGKFATINSYVEKIISSGDNTLKTHSLTIEPIDKVEKETSSAVNKGVFLQNFVSFEHCIDLKGDINNNEDISWEQSNRGQDNSVLENDWKIMEDFTLFDNIEYDMIQPTQNLLENERQVTQDGVYVDTNKNNFQYPSENNCIELKNSMDYNEKYDYNEQFVQSTPPLIEVFNVNDIQPVYNTPKYDTMSILNQTDISQRNEDIFYTDLSQSSMTTMDYTSQHSDMVEDALEMISQDGDYAERMGLQGTTQCLFCTWTGSKLLLEHHIRKKHETEVETKSRNLWLVEYNVEELLARDTWLCRVFDYGGSLYVLSAKITHTYMFKHTLSILSNPLVQTNAYMTVYNKETCEPHAWQGDIKEKPDDLPYDNNLDGLSVNLYEINILSNISHAFNQSEFHNANVTVFIHVI